MAKKPKFTQGDDNINLGKGDDVANAKGGNDSVAGGSGDDTINGGLGNDFLRGGTGDDVLNGGDGDDRLAGGEGDDTLNGGAGVNVVDGGLGDDVVILDGNFKDAKITAEGSGFKIVTAGGTTTVTNVENFQFADGVKGADELITGGTKTFILTVPIDNIVGTSGDDTILGDSSTLTADQIAGNDGKDLLRVALTGTTTNTYTPTMTGVERIESTGGAGTHTFNFANTTGVTSFSLNSGASAVTLSSVKAIADAELSNTTGGSFEIKYDAAAVVGLTDTQKISLTDATLSTLAVNGAETIAVTSAGTKNSVGTITDAAAKAITVSGAGAFTAVTAATTVALASFDASTATGKQTVTFGAVSDVAVKGGTVDDSFVFGATLSSKDSVDGGTGNDTVSVDGADFQAGDGLTALNALKNVEKLAFTGTTGATINDTTLTAVLSAIVFDTTSGATIDTVVDAVATSNYQFGAANEGAAVFTMKAGETTLNLALVGDPTATAAPLKDADVGTLNTGTASVVNISSTGFSTGEVNNVGIVTSAANALFQVKGDAATTFQSFVNQVNFDASQLTGALNVTGSGEADTIRGGSGGSVINGGLKADTIFLTSSTTKIDTVVETATFAVQEGAEATPNTDTVNGFTAGAGGDRLQILDANTTASAGGAIVLQEGGTLPPTILATTDVFEFTLNIAASLAGDDGTVLAAQLGAEVVPATWGGYIVAYSGGNAYVYVALEDNTGTFNAETELSQIAVLNNVAVGGIDVSNFTYSL